MIFIILILCVFSKFDNTSTFTMKNILLLTDFSENAQNAIEYALEFFKGGKYQFFLLNVHKVSNYTTGDLMASSSNASVYDSIIKNPKAALTKMKDVFLKKYSNEKYSFETVCDYDSFLSAVNQIINLKNIDLVVMGTNGATGAKEVIFGSNTLNVIRNVDCPVLIIPQDYEYIKPTTILFVTEYDEVFIEKSLKPLVHVISKFNANLDILALEKEKPISKLSKNKKNEIITFFKDIKHGFYSIHNIPADIAINCFVQLKEVSLVAKIINKESFFKRLISGSTTDEITYNSTIPLLIMHP